MTKKKVAARPATLKLTPQTILGKDGASKRKRVLTAHVASAPASLIQAYQDFTVGKGSNFLRSLLTHSDMESAWRALHRHKKTSDYAMRLFREIVFIEQRSCRPVVYRRTDVREQRRKIARQAQTLADAIEEGPLDRLTFEYFPTEAIAANGLPDRGQLSKLERGWQAHDLLREWPPLTTVLRELADRALELADEAMKEHRIVERASQNKKTDRRLYFVRALAAYIREEFGSPLYGTVASITSAILNESLSSAHIARLVKKPKAN